MSANIDVIRDEMAANADNTIVQQVGEILTALLGWRGELLDRLTAKGKTLSGASSAMANVAKKKKGKSAGVALTVIEGMRAVFEYYEVKPEEVTDEEIMQAAMIACGVPMAHCAPAKRQAEAPTVPDGDLDLDALLGGL